ncbi:hypothetical protein QFC21_003379 [Naganishia friedmannii]|uniref:Uncharacterized protein n=1 Tax=Naganishia friedmannii TaxID=89922 RepID=A0ACC2VQZ4_9TREE|nr:hypothetical protein QFC21_003379 [Naganishia friedmannii]
MADSRLTISAFLAYAQAAWQEDGSRVQQVSSMKDALSSEVLCRMIGMDVANRRYDPFQMLKITYHRLLTRNASAYLLPCPDNAQLDPEKPRIAEFIKLYTLILLSQTVWSKFNERYVKVIQGLEEKYQECLKEIIETALTNLPADQSKVSNGDERDDTTLQEAELCYRLAKKASDIDAQRKHIRKDNGDALPVKADSLLKSLSDTKQSTSPAHERSNFTIGESESDTESATIERHTAGGSVNAPARVSNRIQELEIERLSSDLDEKVDEIRHLETRLEESRQNVEVYLRRASTLSIAELETKVEEVERLRVDVEIHRHASERLRKSENVVDKLRKKLDSVSDARSEIQSLQKQVKTLTEENADWESKYTELFRSRKLHRPTPSSVGFSETDSKSSELSARVDLLELALQAKQAEIVQLKEITVRREEKEVEEAENYASSDDERGAGLKRRAKPRPLSSRSSLHLPESPTQGLGTRTETGSRDEAARQILLGRIEKLQAQLAQAEFTPNSPDPNAENAFVEQELAQSANLTGPEKQVGHQDVTRLEGEVARLQQALAEAERRYRTEKLLMLRAWTELGQRTMKMGVGGKSNGGSTENGDEAAELGRPAGLSWASRVRQRVSRNYSW